MRGWAAAGRLDVNSTGLLVLTQSGLIASQIIGNGTNDDEPHRRVVEKEYLVRLKNGGPHLSRRYRQGDVEILRKIETLREGISDGDDVLRAVSVDIVNDEQIKFVLDEGKKHHLRRMCHHVGWKVQALKRVRIGNVTLGNLPVGCWRWFRTDEESFV